MFFSEKWAKQNEKKKEKKFLISHLKLVELYFTQHTLSERGEKLTGGSPCTMKPFGNLCPNCHSLPSRQSNQPNEPTQWSHLATYVRIATRYPLISLISPMSLHNGAVLQPMSETPNCHSLPYRQPNQPDDPWVGCPAYGKVLRECLQCVWV